MASFKYLTVSTVSPSVKSVSWTGVTSLDRGMGEIKLKLPLHSTANSYSAVGELAGEGSVAVGVIERQHATCEMWKRKWLIFLFSKLTV